MAEIDPNAFLENLAKQFEELTKNTTLALRTSPDAKLPTRGTDKSAGLDFYATETVTIEPNESVVVGTGVALAIPENSVLLLVGRSGLGFKKGLRLANSVGVIDSDYRGEIMAKVHNDSKEAHTIEKGTRFAQGVLVPFLLSEIEEVTNLPTTARGEGGFGHTGEK